MGRLYEAAYQSKKLVQMNSLGKKEKWEFNEWFHGQSGRPMGYVCQSWSTAMYIFAHDCVERGFVNIFNRENGWEKSPAE